MIELKMFGRAAVKALMSLPFAFLPFGEHVQGASLAKLPVEHGLAGFTAEFSAAKDSNLVAGGAESLVAPDACSLDCLVTLCRMTDPRTGCAVASFGELGFPVEGFSADLATDHLAFVAKVTGCAGPGTCNADAAFDVGRRPVELLATNRAGRINSAILAVLDYADNSQIISRHSAVDKSSLIDLEAPRGVTGRKQAQAGQRERLSERTPKGDATVWTPRIANEGGEAGRNVRPGSQERVTDSGWYTGYETINITPQDVMTAAEFDWKQLAGSVSISGLEELQNAGESRVINLLASRIGNLEKSLMNIMSVGIYSDGTGSGSKQVGGLQLLVANDPTTGTVGGINRATWSFWRNQVYDESSDGGATATAASSVIVRYMNALWVKCVRGTDKPDLIVVDNNKYILYLNQLQVLQRYADADMAKAGFTTVKYIDADVVLDGGQGGGCPTDALYMLNTDYIYLVNHSARNMVPLGPKRYSTNQDAHVELVGWAGNMTVSNAALQGVMKP